MRFSRTALLAALLGVLLLRALIRATPAEPPRIVPELAAFCDPKEEAATGGTHQHRGAGAAAHTAEHTAEHTPAHGGASSSHHAGTSHESTAGHSAHHATSQLRERTDVAAPAAPIAPLESSAIATLSPAVTLAPDAFDAPHTGRAP